MNRRQFMQGSIATAFSPAISLAASLDMIKTVQTMQVPNRLMSEGTIVNFMSNGTIRGSIVVGPGMTCFSDCHDYRLKCDE